MRWISNKFKPQTPILDKIRYRSKLEHNVAIQLKQTGVAFEYETLKIPYTVPERHSTYMPDFILGDIIIEVKGSWFDSEDRQKLIRVKEQHPHLDIRIVFDRATSKIYKGSKTTLGKWADDHGFPYADKGTIPLSWLLEAKERLKTQN